MKKYEGLFILNTDGKEEGVKTILDKISAAIVAAGGTVETVQKMDRKGYARVADKRFSSGFYANFIFNGPATVTAALKSKFKLDPDVFRMLFTYALPTKSAK